MPTSISPDLRRRVVETYLLGDVTYGEVAARFRVGSASVSRWLRIYRQTGDVQPRPHGGGHPPRIDVEGLQFVSEVVRQKPDITLAELADSYKQETGQTVALSILCRAMQRLGLVRKKR